MFIPRNIYIKKKLRVWRDQKCIPLLGAKTPVTCAGRQAIPSQGTRYKAKNSNLRKLGWTYFMLPCLHIGNIYIEKKIKVWRDQKCICLVGAKTPLTCAGCQTILSQKRRYRVENRNLRKLGWTYRHGTYRDGTVFAPRQYLYQKEATGIKRQ